MSRAQILAIGVDKVTMQEALDRCLGFLASMEPHLVVTPNAEITYAAARDPALAQVLNGADLVVPDGVGVVWASRILGDPVPQKVAGADLATNLLHALHIRRRGRIYLLGARPEVVAAAARRIARDYPGLHVTGFRDGYFRPEEEPAIIQSIRAANVDILFAALGSPKQEQWLSQNLQALNARVAMGVGGTIDVWAGAAQRAPRWLIRANLEWLFRVVRFGRYGRSLPPLARFMAMVLSQRLRR